MSIALKILTVVGQAGLTIAFKLLTEKFLSRALVIGLRELARKTETKWDDELVAEMEKALDERKPAAGPEAA